ncbi:MAG TPA: hypothetical protein VHV49_14145 [Pseudonocardiaceae bacterium]|jgi:hypothetical protein|nr:hypothetical protein [Pseudonocardiaceae bacterium]
MTTAADAARQPEPSGNPERAKLIAAIAEDASYLRPNLFAVYGVFHEIPGIRPAMPFLGWGMDLGEPDGTLFWDPHHNTTHRAETADRILTIHRRTGEAHLTWLE